MIDLALDPTWPTWLQKAYSQKGVVEVPGPGSNPVIEGYHAVTKGGSAPDGIPWCSSGLCWAFENVGIESPRSKASQDWRNWGTGVGMIVGAVCVISYGGGKGHVGLVVGRTATKRPVLWGANQNNMWCAKSFDPALVIGYRWPSAPILIDPGQTGSTR